MKFFYSFIIVLIVLSVGIEAYCCITGQVLYPIPLGIFQRTVFYFSFFTVLSSIALGVGCLFIILKPNYQSESIVLLRVDGIIGVFITAIVYNIALRAIHHPNLLILKVTNECLHVIIPLLGIMGWVVFDPHNKITKRIIGYSIIPPLLYVLYIFIRGAITGLYPYPILDVNQIGYIKVLINTTIIAVIFVVSAALLYFIDNHWLVKH